jgi:hypothetical protein
LHALALSAPQIVQVLRVSSFFPLARASEALTEMEKVAMFLPEEEPV